MTDLLSREDLQFLLFDWLDVEGLCSREPFTDHDRSSIALVLDLARSVAVEHLLPCYALLDREEPVFDAGRAVLPEATGEAVRAIAESGLTWSVLPAEHGGSDLPLTVHTAANAWLQAANISAVAYPFLTLGNANLLLAHGSPEQIATYVEPMVEGRFTGTMCMSETEAGSSLGDIATSGQPQEDGSYRITGSKMWISGGEHELSENIVHLVLSRTEGAPAGLAGLSLFVVPKFLVEADGSLGERNDVELVGLNHKMGYRGTVNTVLSFGGGRSTPGGKPGAVGYLVGREGEGLSSMFHMMNEARIGVGSGAAALGYAGYRYALAYAKERVQGRPPWGKDPTAAPVAIVEHPDVRRMLLKAKSYVEGAMALVLYAARVDDDIRSAPEGTSRAEASLLLDVLTPIVKSWPSTYGLVANDLAIQVLGGYGYCRDYPVEQLYRDQRLNPIHEGTHGIQALDLLGRKAIMREGAGLRLLLGQIAATADRGRAGFAEQAEALAAAAGEVGEVTARLWRGGDPAGALQAAGIYLDAVGHVVVAWLWLDQVLALGDRADPFAEGKRAAARYFNAYELPVALAALRTTAGAGRLFVELDPDVL
ncbi:MAG: acyl-CoA dehydrogenase [Dermatophilaceae bacterium]